MKSSGSPAARVLHIGKFFPPNPGGIERFLSSLLDAAHAADLPAAALVHQPVWPRQSSEALPYPVFRATSFGELFHAPLSPSFPFMLQRAIQRFKPDILHFHFPNTSAFAALALPSARRLPWVIHWHADVVPSRLDRGLAWTYRYYRLMEQAVLAHSSCIIATSPAYLESSSALARWRSRAIVIPLGIEPQQLPEPSPGIRKWANGQWSSGGLKILGVGRLAYYKGFDVLLKAVAAVPNCQVLLVGKGPCRSALEHIINDHKLQDRVRLLGYLSGDLLCGLMATSDIISMPSVERTEAFGLVLLEAMRYGRPVVASDIPGSGVGWVVRQACHGLLVPPADVDALAAALKRLDCDSELRENLGAAGAAHLAHFHIERTVQRLRDVYGELT